jgi:hypothetical protein
VYLTAIAGVSQPQIFIRSPVLHPLLPSRVAKEWRSECSTQPSGNHTQLVAHCEGGNPQGVIGKKEHIWLYEIITKMKVPPKFIDPIGR